MLKGKKILIGITASIAAYKTISLIRLLVKEGAEIKVIITPAAKKFISPLVISTLSKNQVLENIDDGNSWSNHVMLGRWADVMLIAPLSCNTLAKMSNGICDNLLMAVYLSATCSVCVAPAMDEDMWLHIATKRNLQIIQDDGVKVIQVNHGELASGLYGEGRMEEPESIIKYLTANYFRGNKLKGKKVLITAGPTYEAIDPVRFIGNHSSGKMGLALAEQFFLEGAEVSLIMGPTDLNIPYKEITVKNITSSEEMFNICLALADAQDIFVMAAAVADYTIQEVATQKIKKQEEKLELTLTKTKDILKTLGRKKKDNQILIGFALETNNEQLNAVEKLNSKNADCIILNSLKDSKTGFGYDTNKITAFFKSGKILSFDLKTKHEVAKDIVDISYQLLYEKN